LHSSGYTIPDTDTFLYYLTNNSAAGGVSVLTLPHATVKGRRLLAIPANASSTDRVQVNAQSGNTIYYQIPGGQTSLSSQGPIMLFSDGAGRWYVIATQ
jgi:hypothetical protein